MFDSALSGLGDDIDSLFSKQTLGSAIGAAGQAYNDGVANGGVMGAANKFAVLSKHLDYGTTRQDINGNKVSPTRTQPAATANPVDVEAYWMAKLAKFAGIAGATGTKLGSA